MKKFGRPAAPLQNQTEKYPILRGIFGFDCNGRGWQSGNQTFDDVECDPDEIRALFEDEGAT